MKLPNTSSVTAAFCAIGLITSNHIHAQTPVGSEAALQTAIDGGATSIALSNSFAITTPIYIGTTSSPTITINGNGNSITGTSEIFFVQSGTVTISDAVLSGNAVGGNGGSGQNGGGGALGAGGAIFVGSTANVTVTGVQFTNNSATGGSSSGGTGGNGGGGGMNGGNGGNGNQGSGGGGGNGGAGGAGSFGDEFPTGGGGGGLNSAGTNANIEIGGNGGGTAGGSGQLVNGGNATGPNSGGGGAGTEGFAGGNGTTNGGGGGGGGGTATGGTGGDYAGGGGARSTPGNGGFGGGGGGETGSAGHLVAGAGGFGAGGGSGPIGGAGGVGAGTGGTPANSGGGGGAGLGGAIFVQQGGVLTIRGNQIYSGGSVTGGTGFNNGGAAGTDLFLMTGTTSTFAPGDGSTQTFNGTIADDSAASLPTGNSYTPGTAAGAAVTIGSGDFAGGTVAFNSANTYSGGTTIGNGTTFAAGNAGALGSGLVDVAGTGTLTVGNGNHIIDAGSYTQAANGTLSLNLTGAGGAATEDELVVSNGATGPNAAALGGGTLVVNLGGFTNPPGSYGQRYTFNVVSTAAGYTGTFGTFDPLNVAANDFVSLLYTPDNVALNVAILFPTGGLTPNQDAVLRPINNSVAVGNITAAGQVIINGLSPLGGNPQELGSALDELSPQAFGQFVTDTAFNNASFAVEARDSYLANRRAGANGTFAAGHSTIDSSGLTVNDPSYDPGLAMVHSRLLAWNPAPSGLASDVPDALLGGVDMKDMKSMSAPMADDHPWNFFVEGNVILAQGFSNADVSHFDDNTESVTLGVDYRVTPNLLVGLTAGYGHTDVTLDNNGSSATVDSYSPGFYASYADHGWYANVTGNYLHNAYTQSRVIGFLDQTATSAPQGNEGVASLDGGYEFHHGHLTYGPLAGIQYTHLSVDGYSEGGSAADLTVNDQEADSLRSRLGGRVSYNFTGGGVIFTPHLDASWQHEFMDQSRGITSQFNSGLGSFDVRTINPSRDSALVDAGLDAALNSTVTIYADYIAEAGQENYFGQSVQGGIKIGF
jgi:uncharacterized protein YhjY with autotransporter beta-barrel domain